MKIRALYGLLVLTMLLSACGLQNPDTTPTTTLAPARTLPSASIRTTSAPDPDSAARTYLNAWKAEDFASMYALLTKISRDAIDEETFRKKYTQVAAVAALKEGIDYEILSALVNNPTTAQVSYRVSMHSVLVGDIVRETVMNLSLEEGSWRVQWDEGLILPELRGGNYLVMDYHIPARANIYDREGHALASQTDAVAIGLDAAQVDLENVDGLLSVIARMTNNQIRPETLLPKIQNYAANGWYLPITDMSADAIAPYQGTLSSFSGVILQPFRTRYYEGIAPHVTGYMSLIGPDEVEEKQRLGYNIDERVGRDGLELYAEPYLAGKRAGTLYVMGPDNKVVTQLASTNTEPSAAVYTTIDSNLQRGVQLALNGFKGAAAVIEVDTGRVLALASSPGYNANLFEPSNFNSSRQINEEINNENIPLLNRATLGQYPLGSVFKIITMAAALESGLYTPDTEYNCGYHFNELPGLVLNDWTWDHYQEDGKTGPSGLLTLSEGLMRSCNPYFYHIGLDLFSRGMVDAISGMARGFGLGSPTGIEIGEEKGQILDPEENIDATNYAIGQGETLVTPIQVAQFVAALANGGTIYQPTVIDRIVPPTGDPTYVFTPTVKSKLPISEATLTAIHEAMVDVVKDPRGTAVHRFRGFNVPVAGKTGTAQDPPRKPHAWFVAYTFADNPNKPDIAVVVVVENTGEGSDYAAPIARRIMEVYFSGKPLTLFWWESQFGVWRTPTPDVTDTPEIEEEEEATPEP